MAKKPKIAIIGRPNVGKSTLFNKLSGKRTSIVDQLEGVTRDRVYASAEWLSQEFNIIDTGGFVSSNEDIFNKKITIKNLNKNRFQDPSLKFSVDDFIKKLNFKFKYNLISTIKKLNA